ncbi:thioredoxin [Listeria phage LMTA-57]|uniref:Thioredoxin n=3 Tax=Pecentumvirus TaxID=1857844 RepID=A0A060AC78_9CAUD|nr:thioredoxin domain [Listeria phage LMSP-25]YP_009616255.1 thioredoxin domain [Listeria phage LMTA-34]YP_009793390.1 thioredoxin [Listeria phage LMTA-57]AIA64495.1 thioredoxin [Listeria phage LMSP-25]AID17053.1 thioredoxin [Listeria phage LMTA-34]AID17541.1 thioredoxin [Listeria phage LMTA-57]
MTKKNIKITSKMGVRNNSVVEGDIFYIEGVSKGLTNLSGLYIVTFDFRATEESLLKYALVSLETGKLSTISINQFVLEEKAGCIVKVSSVEIIANTKEV